MSGAPTPELTEEEEWTYHNNRRARARATATRSRLERQENQKWTAAELKRLENAVLDTSEEFCKAQWSLDKFKVETLPKTKKAKTAALAQYKQKSNEQAFAEIESLKHICDNDLGALPGSSSAANASSSDIWDADLRALHRGSSTAASSSTSGTGPATSSSAAASSSSAKSSAGSGHRRCP